MRTYFITAQAKVGRQNIGPCIGYGVATGDKKDLLARMQRMFPRCRVSGIEITPGTEFDRVEFHVELKRKLGKPAGMRVDLNPVETGE